MSAHLFRADQKCLHIFWLHDPLEWYATTDAILGCMFVETLLLLSAAICYDEHSDKRAGLCFFQHLADCAHYVFQFKCSIGIIMHKEKQRCGDEVEWLSVVGWESSCSLSFSWDDIPTFPFISEKMIFPLVIIDHPTTASVHARRYSAEYPITLTLNTDYVSGLNMPLLHSVQYYYTTAVDQRS